VCSIPDNSEITRWQSENYPDGVIGNVDLWRRCRSSAVWTVVALKFLPAVMSDILEDSFHCS